MITSVGTYCVSFAISLKTMSDQVQLRAWVTKVQAEIQLKEEASL